MEYYAKSATKSLSDDEKKIIKSLSPTLSAGEGVGKCSCLLVGYKTNLTPSPTERVGERL